MALDAMDAEMMKQRKGNQKRDKTELRASLGGIGSIGSRENKSHHNGAHRPARDGVFNRHYRIWNEIII